MASKKKTTPEEPGFFKGYRKTITVGQVSLLKNSSGDRRIKIAVTLNLTEDGDGKPEFVAKLFDAVAKEESNITLAKSSVELEGTIVGFFATDKGKTPVAKSGSCTLRTFSMTTKKTRGKDLSDVVLSFSIYAPASEQLWDWGYKAQGEEVYAEFQPTQMTFGDAEPEAAEAAE